MDKSKSSDLLGCRSYHAWAHVRYIEYKAGHPNWPHQGRVPCVDCGEPARGLRCKACDGRYRVGERAPNWKGGSLRNGYLMISANGKRVREHRHIWEQARGPILPGWVIHHLNGIRHDNRLENLVMMPKQRHDGTHRKRTARRETYVQLLQTRIRELESQLAQQWRR